jgi:arylsulfatase A-like enzyme
MSKKAFERLGALSALLIIISYIWSCAARSGPLNVLLISADTLRADRLNSYGYNAHNVSPNIDGLARDGILFENHIAASPWTTPSHMSMLTSLSPSAHGIVQSFETLINGLNSGTFNRLGEDTVTLAESLQSGGYTTAAFTGGITLDRDIGFDQGFETYDTSMYKLNDQNMSTLFDWLGAHTTTPFFLFWHTFEVHAPYLHTTYLPEEHTEMKSKYDDLARSVSGEASLDGHSSNNAKLVSFLQASGAFEKDVCEALYLGGVKSMDEWLGRLIADLKKRDLYDRTLIVFTSDHGDEFGDHDPNSFYDKHGHSLYDEMIRVPLIIKLPNQQFAQTRVSAVTRAIDIMPTVLDILALEPERNQMQGESLRPLWLDPATAHERVALTEAAVFKHELKAVRTSQFKYIIQIPLKSVEEHGRSHIPGELPARLLFNLEEDPLEKQNLLGPAQHGPALERAAELDALLRGVVTAQLGKPEEVHLDDETVKRLKSLGYVQ